MNLNRAFAWLGGPAILGAALYAYAQYIYFLGFPDGHIDALGAAERKLAIVFIAVSVPTGAYLLHLGWRVARRSVGARLAVAAALYLLFLLGMAAADAYCHAHLPGGGGG